MKPGPQNLEKPGPIGHPRDLPSGFCGFWTLCRRFESCGLETPLLVPLADQKPWNLPKLQLPILENHRKPGNSTATKSSEIDTLSLLQPQDISRPKAKVLGLHHWLLRRFRVKICPEISAGEYRFLLRVPWRFPSQIGMCLENISVISVISVMLEDSQHPERLLRHILHQFLANRPDHSQSELDWVPSCSI